MAETGEAAGCERATPQEAAKNLSASYWTSMIQPPPMSELPARFKSQDEWLATLRHTGATTGRCARHAPNAHYTTPKDLDAMFLRAQSMHRELDAMGKLTVEKMLADWGSRIAAGEVPPARGQPALNAMSLCLSGNGVPRVLRSRFNLYRQRDPTLYPNGKVYGVDRTGGGRLLILDPVKNTTSWLQVEPRDKSHGYSLTKDYYHGADKTRPIPGRPGMDRQPAQSYVR